MRLSLQTRPQLRLQARLDLAAALVAPESAVAAHVVELEHDPLFGLLITAKVISRSMPVSLFAARQFAGYGLRVGAEGLPELFEKGEDVGGIIQQIGESRFQEFFLGDSALSASERASRCGISEQDAVIIGEYLNRLYIKEDLSASADTAPAEQVYSPIARIGVEDGKPLIAFFERAVWQGRYSIDTTRRATFLSGLPTTEAARVSTILSELSLIEHRKTTLYRLLELGVSTQSAFLSSRDLGKRVPLTQRFAASRLGVSPSVVNQMIGNKSVETPWGIEFPLSVLFPSRKTVLKEKVYVMALNRPGLSDDSLRNELASTFGVLLSRQTIACYRLESGVGRKRGRPRLHLRAQVSTRRSEPADPGRRAIRQRASAF